MAEQKSKKPYFVEISSSEEFKSSSPESDEDTVQEISSSTSCNEDDVEEDDDESDWNHSEDEDEDCDYVHADKDDAESMCNKVIQLIRGGSDIQELKLNECKAYLRRHKLRLSGTKEECIERIKEHYKLKDGNGEVFYPRSSFIIDCTGDVCKGDIVLFHQKVYQISARLRRTRFQQRTVAGRIVKESYGAAKQQHTFTSRGTKELDPLFPLLVKGRNLYKMKTFRQPWKNEKDRIEVLSEKHRRGAAARTIRSMRKSKAAMKADKSLTNKGPKHGHLSLSRIQDTTVAKRKCTDDHEVLAKRKKRVWSQSSSLSSKQSGGFRGSASHRRHQNLIQSNQFRESPSLPCYYPSQAFNHFHSDVFPTELRNYIPHGGFASTSGLPESHAPSSEWTGFSHGSYFGPAYSHSINRNEARSFNSLPGLMNNRTSFYSNPYAYR